MATLPLAVSCVEGRGHRCLVLLSLRRCVATSRIDPQPHHRLARSLDDTRSASVLLVYLGHDSPAAIELEQ